MTVQNNIYPKVLIIGETFRFNGGGGITMINLFKNWPKKNIAIITDLINETTPEANCSIFYQLGSLERRYRILSFFSGSNVKSGEIEIKKHLLENECKIKKKKLKRLTLKIILFRFFNFFSPFFVILGIDKFFIENRASQQLLDWIDTFSPNIIFATPFMYNRMSLIHDVIEKRNYPLAIHITDDLINVINKPNLLYFYWRKKINFKYESIIQRANVLMSISEAMSVEFQKRYGRIFIPFRNPIDVSNWEKYEKNDWAIKFPAKVIYFGRLTSVNTNTLEAFCLAINELNKDKIQIELDIFTSDINVSFSKKNKKHIGIKILPPIKYNDMPKTITKYDFALLPFDFNKKGIKYAKYSISTKTSECMISGVPIILVAPNEIATTAYAIKNKSMHIINNNDPVIIKEGIVQIVNDTEQRKLIAQSAKKIAKQESDASLVRKQFLNLINSGVAHN